MQKKKGSIYSLSLLRIINVFFLFEAYYNRRSNLEIKLEISFI